MFNTVTSKKIAVFGFAFKKDTGDVRETPAVTICDMLMEDGAILQVCEPKVTRESAVAEMRHHGMTVPDEQFKFAASAVEAVQDAHAIVVLTEWEEFKTYDYADFYQRMMKPAFVFDGRNLLDPFKLESIGFEAHMLGKSRIVDENDKSSTCSVNCSPINNDKSEQGACIDECSPAGKRAQGGA